MRRLSLSVQEFRGGLAAAMNKAPVSRSAMEKALESAMRSLEPSITNWSTNRVLDRWRWIMEDDQGFSDVELNEHLVASSDSFATSEKFVQWINEIFYGPEYDNNDEDWLESNWDIGFNPNNPNYYLFNTKEAFVQSLDIGRIVGLLNLAWDRACDKEDFEKLQEESGFDEEFDTFYYLNGRIISLARKLRDVKSLGKEVMARAVQLATLLSLCKKAGMSEEEYEQLIHKVSEEDGYPEFASAVSQIWTLTGDGLGIALARLTRGFKSHANNIVETNLLEEDTFDSLESIQECCLKYVTKNTIDECLSIWPTICPYVIQFVNDVYSDYVGELFNSYFFKEGLENPGIDVEFYGGWEFPDELKRRLVEVFLIGFEEVQPVMDQSYFNDKTELADFTFYPEALDDIKRSGLSYSEWMAFPGGIKGASVTVEVPCTRAQKKLNPGNGCGLGDLRDLAQQTSEEAELNTALLEANGLSHLPLATNEGLAQRARPV